MMRAGPVCRSQATAVIIQIELTAADMTHGDVSSYMHRVHLLH